MKNHAKKASGIKRQVLKTPTGIQGLDEITEGGLPKGRPTLLCGGAGSGKTLMAMEFIVRGATDFNENGVYISFEESKDELCDNVASLGFDLDLLYKDKLIYIRELDLQAQDVVELGGYDLEGLFAQIGYTIDSVNAKRIVIDGIETLFSSFSREHIIRKELKRLFRWLKERNMATIITSERGDGLTNITRHGIEEYISDCVIILDQRIVRQISTRRLRILKYRGSRHGTNEYPFLVTDNGISVIPITSMALEHEASLERVPTGIEKLDEMFGGQGYYKGSSVLITGTAGTGKSSFAGSFAKSVCESGNRCIYFSFEESAKQIVRNMGAIGLNLKPFIEQNLLTVHAIRPTLQGLELHLLKIQNLIIHEKPSAVILDPISNLAPVGNFLDIKLMFIRILDVLKMKNITALFTDLTNGENFYEATEVGISSIMDSWILLQQKPIKGQRERSLYVVKARGIGHSNQIRPFEIGNEGIEIGESLG
jgi:circadian clock protein KaiC